MHTTNDYLNTIRQPVNDELQQFSTLFAESLSHADGRLNSVLNYIQQRVGKLMRPTLILLMARVYGKVNDSTYRSALALELIHTASLIHDDVVDEASDRRGQQSVNAVFDNKIAVLVGDYILSTALVNVGILGNIKLVNHLARLGQTLANGEILQLTSNGSEEISEEAYFDVIKNKTAVLFEECCSLGAMSVGADETAQNAAAHFGQTLGTMFQIRDDIFDYYDSSLIGKPTGNDMAEGKLTLPAIYAITEHGDDHIMALAQRVKACKATKDDIATLIAFTKANVGLDYAERKTRAMQQ